MDLHKLPGGERRSTSALSRAKAARRARRCRRRSSRAIRAPHFRHIFTGDGYAAGYYSYLWSEVLDADAFEAFVASGDVFDPALAERLRKYVYAAGGTRAPEELYASFRGRAPDAQALLRKRGLG